MTTPVGRRSRAQTIGIGLVAVIVGTLLTACLDTEPEVMSTDACSALVAEAATAREIDDQIEFFDRAISVCRSPEAFAAELARFPGAVGVGAEELIGRRCDRNPELSAAILCRSALAVVDTTLPGGTGAATYVGLTLDDREIAITPQLTRFEDDRPWAVAEIETAAGRGCEGLLSEYIRWFTRITNPVTGDEASVYARYALDLMRGAGCPLPE